MSRTVLLVDDDENILRGLARTLRFQPFRLYTARTAEEAIEALKAHQVDVVVSDEHMPGMSGSRLLAWIAEHCPEVMRIVLTGHATVETAIRAINEGAVYHFFTKPCDPVQLAVVIRKALEHKELLEENRRLLAVSRSTEQPRERLHRTVHRLQHGLTSEVIRPLRALCRRLESLQGQTRPLDAQELLPLTRAPLAAAQELQQWVAALVGSGKHAEGSSHPAECPTQAIAAERDD